MNFTLYGGIDDTKYRTLSKVVLKYCISQGICVNIERLLLSVDFSEDINH